MSVGGWIAVVVASIAALGAIAAALISARAARSARRANRVEQLEATIEELHQDRHQLWFYARQLVDHIYSQKPPPPPAPPEGLFK